jgi:hypothetical protein
MPTGRSDGPAPGVPTARGMPHDALLVVGWAQDAFVLPAAVGRRARGLPVTLLDR